MKTTSMIFYLMLTLSSIFPVLIFKELKFLFQLKLHAISTSITSLLLTSFLVFGFFEKKQNFLRKYNVIKSITGERFDLPYYIIISLLAAISEELLFRGYCFAGLQLLINGIIIPTIITSLIFALFHAIQGIEGFTISFIASILFCITTYYSRSIIPVIALHFLFDFIELSVIIPYNRQKFIND